MRKKVQFYESIKIMEVCVYIHGKICKTKSNTEGIWISSGIKSKTKVCSKK